MRFGVIYHKLWSEKWFKELDDSLRLLVLYLFANPHCNLIGFYRFHAEYAAKDLTGKMAAWPIDDTVRRLARLELLGIVKVDADAGVILISGWLKYRQIVNINQAIKGRKCLDDLPDTALVSDFRREMKKHAEAWVSTVLGKGEEQTPAEPSKTSKRLSAKGQIFKTTWNRLYDKLFPSPYIWSGAKDDAITESLVANFDLDQLEELIGRFLATSDDFLASAGHTVGTFKSRINQLTQQAARPAGKEISHAKGQGKRTAHGIAPKPGKYGSG